MKPRAVLALALLCSGLALAEPCAKLEYAELDAMPKEDLLRLRCEYNSIMLDPELMKTGRYWLAVGNKCAEELNRFDRLLARKYPLKSAKGSPEELREISAMCPPLKPLKQ